MFKRNFTITILLAMFVVLQGFCQETELSVSKKQKVKIKLSDRAGENKIPDAYFDDKDSLWFSLELIGDDVVFSKGMITDLSQLKIIQNDRTTLSGKIKSKFDLYARPIKLIFPYSKASIDVYKPFEFKYEDYPAVATEIQVYYWPKYHEFDQYFSSGKKLNEQLKYIESYQQLQNVLPGKENHIYYKKFTEYDQVINELIPSDISNTLTKFENKLSFFRNNYGTKDEIETNEIDQLKLTLDSVNLYKALFTSYYDEIKNSSKALDLAQRHVKLADDFKGFYNECRGKWKTTMLHIFETGVYGRENKFTVYSNLLVRLLCYNQNVKAISPLDSIDVSLVLNQSVELSFVKGYTDLLYDMDWEIEFISIIKVINDEIKINNRILPPGHLDNFHSLINSEEQPNYYILSAFNELAKEREDGFVNELKMAISKCTDKELLYHLELWMFANDIKRQKISKDVLININQGMDNEAIAKANEAFESYKKASRLNDNFALPYFLMGRIELAVRKNNLTADQYFNDAIRCKADFALARIFHLEILIENQQYKDVLNEITAIHNSSYLNIWYIYYLNAKVLYLMKDYPGALTLLTGTCSNFNKNCFEQLLLTGDIFQAQNNCVESKKNYSEAGQLRPDNPDYTSKLKEHYEKCK
jgi:hypothetical protein